MATVDVDGSSLPADSHSKSDDLPLSAAVCMSPFITLLSNLTAVDINFPASSQLQYFGSAQNRTANALLRFLPHLIL